MIRHGWECTLAGRLAWDTEMPGPWSPIFINKERSVQFSIKVLSDSPETLSDVEYFTCWANNLPDFEDDLIADEDERIENLRLYLQDKIILFRPFLRIDHERNGRYHLAQPVIAVLDAPQALEQHSRLIPLLHLPSMTPEEFEEKLARRYPVASGSMRTFAKDMPIADPIVVWVQDHLYGPFEAMRHGFNGWLLGGEAIRKIKVDMSELASLVLPYRNVVFVEGDLFYQVLVPKLESEGEALKPATSGAQAQSAVMPAAIKQAGAEAAAAGEAPGAGASNGQTTATAVDRVGIMPEAKFLEQVKALAQAKRLFYDEEDVVNFHTALKTGSLVLLSGMSGTGKSRLVQLYAEALGLSDEQFAMIPVRPTWTDDSDLLGFLDLTHNIYRPAESGLVDLLIRAHQNPDKLFMVCFDEMNLARVEHYFSQFISVLELETDLKYITLYGKAMEDRVYNAAHYPARLPIGPNILFVGTVNVDESTYAFSDKVLDRAHVIRLKVLPFSGIWAYEEQNSAGIQPVPIPFTTYDHWRSVPLDIKLTQGELEFLEKLHIELQKVDLQRGVGHRTVRQIDRFIRNIPVDEDGILTIERSVAFDLQIVQKVLTKLRGPSEQLGSLVGKLDHSENVESSSLIQLLDEYEDLSSFALSRQVLKQKAKELKAYGYAS